MTSKSQEQNLNVQTRTNRGGNLGIPAMMFPRHDKEESASEDVGLWSLVDHSDYAVKLHKSQQVEGVIPTIRHDG